MLDSTIVGSGLGCWLRVPRQNSKAPEVDFIADADSAGLLPTLIYSDEADGIAGAEFAIPIESYSMHARVSRRQKPYQIMVAYRGRQRPRTGLDGGLRHE